MKVSDNYVLNFQLLGKITDGNIINRKGELYYPFKKYIETLRFKGYSESTISVYAEHVFRFLNYLSCYIEIINFELDSESYFEILKRYSDFLRFGEDSRFKVIRRVTRLLKRKNKIKNSSIKSINSAISSFILINEDHEELKERDTILYSICERKRSNSELRKIHRNWAMSGFIRGKSPSKKTSTVVAVSSPRSNRIVQHTTHSIELSKIRGVIESASNFRDKAIYAFLAASGCRTHEALQIKIEHIDLSCLEIKLISPFNAKFDELGITRNEYDQLRWKGRTTPSTFLIEPFKSLFFKYLHLYMRNEYCSIVSHTFIFQNLNNGRPAFTLDRSSRIATFKKAARKAGIINVDGISPHSLRHSYAIYVLNWLPLSDGTIGLPVVTVKLLLGHSSITSTERYAKLDEELVKAHVADANEQLFNFDGDINQVKRNYHLSELEKLKECA